MLKMRHKSALTKIVLLSVIILFTISCEQFDAPDTIDGLWICKQSSDNGIPTVYNIRIESSLTDTTQFTASNLFNLGWDFEVNLSLHKSVFKIDSCNQTDYFVTGNGKFDPKPKNYRIEWLCNAVGPRIQEKNINIISTKE